jgi:hypothetical protein
MKEDGMGGICSTHVKDEKCIQYINWKTLREEIIRETEAYIKG